MKVYVARHAEAEHNISDTFHDETLPDVSLTKRGFEQAEELAQNLARVPFDVIYVSELQRTQQTAAAVNKNSVPVVIDRRLNDIVSGIAGMSVSEFRQMIYSTEDSWNSRFEGGESFEEEKRRVIEFLEMLKTLKYRTVFVVTSGGIANILFGLVYGLDNDTMFNRQIPNADTFSFDLDVE